MSTAELSDIRIENVTDPVKPFVYAYHVRVPGYAQRTGKRLFLQPAFSSTALLLFSRQAPAVTTSIFTIHGLSRTWLRSNCPKALRSTTPTHHGLSQPPT
jgi:hypothetical protein